MNKKWDRETNYTVSLYYKEILECCGASMYSNQHTTIQKKKRRRRRKERKKNRQKENKEKLKE